MSGMTDFLENAILNHVLRGEVYTPPSALYLGFFTSDPGEAGTGTEVSGSGYARRAIMFTKSTSSSSSNAADILSTVSTAAWGTITHFGLFDALTGGTLLIKGALTPTVPITAANQQARLPAGSVVVNAD